MHRATSKLVMNMVRFLNDDALSVLTCSPGNLILDSIAATRHVKMQVLTEKVLRITGDKEASMAALSDISKKCLAAIKQVLPLLPATYDHAKDTLVGKDVFVDRNTVSETPSVFSLSARSCITAADIAFLRSTTGVMAKFSLDERKKVRVPCIYTP